MTGYRVIFVGYGGHVIEQGPAMIELACDADANSEWRSIFQIEKVEPQFGYDAEPDDCEDWPYCIANHVEGNK